MRESDKFESVHHHYIFIGKRFLFFFMLAARQVRIFYLRKNEMKQSSHLQFNCNYNFFHNTRERGSREYSNTIPI